MFIKKYNMYKKKHKEREHSWEEIQRLVIFYESWLTIPSELLEKSILHVEGIQDHGALLRRVFRNHLFPMTKLGSSAPSSSCSFSSSSSFSLSEDSSCSLSESEETFLSVNDQTVQV